MDALKVNLRGDIIASSVTFRITLNSDELFLKRIWLPTCPTDVHWVATGLGLKRKCPWKSFI